ncbi:hypothetical protein [Streptomyces sp. NPDC017964]|uniref:hypothetical protein n=1 Tax=Streptomyces sp. NPDC017964 TaxID=3365022 RepID=UPI0037A6602F
MRHQRPGVIATVVVSTRRGSLVADYAAHAHKAQELLEAAERGEKGRLSAETRVRMAQVEALLALAAAIDKQESAASR